MSKLTCSIPLNYQGLIELDTNYGGTANWVKLAAGINNIAPANNDSIDQKQYMDGEGFGSTDVIGMQLTLAVSGDRILTDDAQNFVFDVQYEVGCNRKTQCRVTDAEGNYKTGEVTICNITPPGGDAAAKGAFTFEIHYNGKPTFTTATTAPDLSAVVSAGSVTGSTSFAATPTGDNTLGYLLTTVAPTSVKALSFVSVNSYTSGSNIAATAGQVLNMLELDANGRVVKFLSETLDAADIA